MKKNILWCCFFISIFVLAGNGGKPTEKIIIKGKIKEEIKITIDDFKNYQEKIVGDIILTNQRGEVKDTIKKLKGILLKDILKKVELQADRPKLFNEFYFTFIASDGYKVVFSWNEIFNTEVGNNIFIVTEQNGVKAKDMMDRIQLVSKSDISKGRRYVENLSEIIVNRVE
jgi:hypothetical protein